jgi:4-amino-4-deoxy-L-arabinose transferase-like glycosyltransferase
VTPAAWSRRETGFFLLAMAWIVLTLGIRPLALPDEGRYVSAAWEMLVSGNWLYPTLDGLPFFHKPPLYYWLTAGSLAVFGPHDWAARLAPVVGAAAAAFTLYGFALRQSSPHVARLSLLVLVTAPLYYGSAQFASLDMLVAGFISATTVLAAEAVINASTGKPYRTLLAAAYACAALGVLSKGLIGAVLPGLAIVIWLLWSRRPALLLKLLWVPGLALFALIAAPWFVAMQERFPDFFHYFFVYQQFQRFARTGFNNPQPFWFYLPVLAVGLLPWSLLIVPALRKRAGTAAGALSARSLMWISAAVTVGFFSIPTSKMIGYVLPAVPPLAFLIAEGLGWQWQDEAEMPRKLRWFAVAAIVLCVVAVIAGRVANKQSAKQLSQQIAAQRQAGEPVYFLKYQFLDVPFYLRLREPVKIFDDWAEFAKVAATHDDWRSTLFDAGEFDPARARQLLVERSQLTAALCAQKVSWVIAKKSSVAGSPAVSTLTPFYERRDRVVFRVTSDELAAKALCPQMPSDGSPGTSASPPPPG